MKVAIEDVLKLDAERAKINRQSIDCIEWTYRGEVIKVPKDFIDEWKFTGLNNCDLVHHNLPQLLGIQEWEDES